MQIVPHTHTHKQPAASSQSDSKTFARILLRARRAETYAVYTSENNNTILMLMFIRIKFSHLLDYRCRMTCAHTRHRRRHRRRIVIVSVLDIFHSSLARRCVSRERISSIITYSPIEGKVIYSSTGKHTFEPCARSAYADSHVCETCMRQAFHSLHFI